jgi:hypothetical protein
MYRIVAVTACAAMLAGGLAFGTASAATCDERIAGSCPIEPIPEEVDANAEAAAARPLAYARAGKEGGVRRARRASRSLSRAERRRTAAAVASAIAREREPVRVEPQRQRAQVEPRRPDVQLAPQPSLAYTAVSPVAASPPTVARMLSPTFIQTTDLVEPTLEPSLIAILDEQATRAVASEPALAMSAQAASEPPAPATGSAGAANVGQAPSAAVQAAATEPAGTADAPWLRFAFLAFGGLIALGSAIRLFV